MGNAGVLLSGAVLFLNGLMLRGKADVKSVAVFNFFVGLLQIIIPFYLIIASDQSTWALYEHTATFLFGLTFLYVSITFYKGLDGRALGWFSIWVAMIAIFYALISAFHFHNYVLALTWVMWSFLWYLYYALNVLQKSYADYVGKVAVVQSFVTLTFPAMLTLIGVWEKEIIQFLWLFVLVLSTLYFVKSGMKDYKQAKT